MSYEGLKVLIQNMNQESLLDAISRRDDIAEIIQMFRYKEDYAQREYLTLKEFQVYLKCSYSYARNLAIYGLEGKSFTVIRIGKDYRIDKLSYERWISKGGHM